MLHVYAFHITCLSNLDIIYLGISKFFSDSLGTILTLIMVSLDLNYMYIKE